MVRNMYNAKLKHLESELYKLCSLCEFSIKDALNSLVSNKDSISDDDIKDKFSNIQSLTSSLDEECINLLLEESPVASDFRLIIATLLMLSDLTRISTQSYRITSLAKDFNHNNLNIEDTSINILGEMAINMVRKSISAITSNNLEEAESIIFEDSEIDKVFNEVKQNISKMIASKPSCSNILMDVLLIAKYYERIGDHSVNIAKLVKYRICGTSFK
ncbi:MAG: phosphate signaling complex protein PhoU [Succinivibrionaceae bacterium]